MRLVALVGALALASCGDSILAKSARDVLTWKRGTVTRLERRRGDGPFHEAPLPPATLVGVVAEVLLAKTPAVFPDVSTLAVVAKERSGEDARLDTYAPDWRSAVVVYVHPVADDPKRSRFEVHGTHRGPFHRGAIEWERELPPLVLAAASRKRAEPVRPL